MNTYRSLFRVEVVHDYFTGTTPGGLAFRPDAPSRAWLDRMGCVVRTFGNALLVHYDQAGILGRVAASTPPDLWFTIEPEDGGHTNYTQPPGPDKAAAAWLFDTGPAPQAGQAALRDLSPDPVFREGLSSALQAGPRLAPMYLRVRFGPDMSNAGAVYRLRLTSRSLVLEIYPDRDMGRGSPLRGGCFATERARDLARRSA